MKKLTKIFSFIICVLTVVGTFSACKGGELTQTDAVSDVPVIEIPEGAYKLTLAEHTNGRIQPLPSYAKPGERIYLETEAEAGYEFSHFLLNGVKIKGDSFIMQRKDCTVLPIFEKTVQYRESDINVSATTKYGGKQYTARADFFAEYKEDGVEIFVTVKDENLYSNPTIRDQNKKDEIVFAIGLYGKKDLKEAKALKFTVAADGYSMAFPPSGAESFSSKTANCGVFVNKDYTVYVKHADKSTNGFDGYYARIFIKYSAFGLDGESDVGELAILPALRNTVLVNGKSATSLAGMGSVVRTSGFIKIEAQ